MSSSRNRIIAAVIVAAALFYVAAPLLMPKPTTGSTNARFNDWVKYYQRQDGYTVEYHDFDTFSEEVDTIRLLQALEMSEDVVDYMDEMGAVTVYYDGEIDRIFYIGTGADPSQTYGFYCTF
jgi:hypothetical protein